MNPKIRHYLSSVFRRKPEHYSKSIKLLEFSCFFTYLERFYFKFALIGDKAKQHTNYI